ncbi:MAG: metallophosphoesterase [Pedobacter sp.]|nr:metallophosphoesterase [Pedobacter sp.]
MKRRNFLKASAASVALSTLPNLVKANSNSSAEVELSFALLTDVHLEPTVVAVNGFTRALKAINNQKIKPSFIINGGDSIFDSLERPEKDIAAQWEVWHKINAEQNKLPMFHCIGNHDVYGWMNPDPAIKNSPDYGKARVLRELKMSHSYYKFKMKSWNFIVLDSVHKHPKGYEARLDEEQFKWLATQLQDIPRQEPIVIISHMPLFSAVYNYVFEGKTSELFTDLTNRILVHRDGWEIKELIKNYPNVKLCLSGHLHLQEEINYLQTSYVNCGAVCGNWWKGKLQEFEPAFFNFHLLKDGSFKYEVVNY